MNIAIIGPPGAGKDTQACALSARMGASHVSAGALIRREIEAGTDLGRRMRSSVHGGWLFPPREILRLVLPHLAAADWILTGLPRTLTQAQELAALLEGAGRRLTLVVELEVPDDELMVRLRCRVQSLTTARLYDSKQPSAIDDPGPFVRRDDDTPLAIRRRLAIHRAEQEPIREYYAAQNLLMRIDARPSAATVTTDIVRALIDRGLE